VGQNSPVGISTVYGLDGPGFESRWGGFSVHVQPVPGAHTASYTMGTGSFSRVKRLERVVGHQPARSAAVEERIELLGML
jgi:hypothetical protein